MLTRETAKGMAILTDNPKNKDIKATEIAKNLVRGKPLPPGIAKKAVPASMLEQLPHYPGYEWRIAGNDLVLIAVSTAIVTSIINNVFD